MTSRVARIANRAAMALLGLLIAAAGWGALAPLPSEPGQTLDGGRTALWMGRAWFEGSPAPARLDALVADLEAHRVRDVFIRVGPVDAQGRIPQLVPSGWPGVRNRLAARGIRLFAWMDGATRWSRGDVPEALDMADPRTRARLTRTAKALVDVAHFDGVQYDLAVTPNGDVGLLALLDETRATCPSAAISVAGPNVRPPWLPVNHLWTPEYYGEVAARCDLVAVMSFDTGLPTAAAYSRYVRWEMNALCGHVERARLRAGVATSREAGRARGAKAESAAAALRGLSNAPRGCFDGIAVYGEFADEPVDWAGLPR